MCLLIRVASLGVQKKDTVLGIEYIEQVMFVWLLYVNDITKSK